jgi:hypothetical protein
VETATPEKEKKKEKETMSGHASNVVFLVTSRLIAFTSNVYRNSAIKSRKLQLQQLLQQPVIAIFSD